MKVPKGQSILDTIEDRRRRLRELEAGRRAVEAAPVPSSVASARMREQIEAIARRGEPDVGRLIEGPSEIEFARRYEQVVVQGAGVGGVSAPDAFSLLTWLLRDQLIARLDAAIKEQSDDRHALTDEQRAERFAQIEADALAVELGRVSVNWDRKRMQHFRSVSI